VPTVMLLGEILQNLATSPTDKALGWLVLAWASTVAGNFCLVGSIANLIVAEKGAASGNALTFWRHFKFASWSCVLTIFAGDCILFYVVRPWLEDHYGSAGSSSSSVDAF
jgi:Na+/H+ antiporter NhaD/arsenite permease-like protein